MLVASLFLLCKNLRKAGNLIMADTTKNYLDHAGLSVYDEKLKKVISDANSITLQKAKEYVDKTTTSDVTEKLERYGTTDIEISDPSLFTFDSSTGTITGYSGGETNVVIPYKINGVKVVTIGDGAFSGNTDIESVVIPNSVIRIDTSAFDSCENLTTIIIPDSVTSIGFCAFANCACLNPPTIPDSVTTIEDEAFYCSGVESMTFPDSVKSIGDRVFNGCTGFGSVTLSNSITTISYGMFVDCISLEGITIPDSVTIIYDEAFCSSGIKSITIPDSVTTIGDGAFLYCDFLTDVYFKGTTEQWNKITIGENNDPLLAATIHYDISFPLSVENGGTGVNSLFEFADIISTVKDEDNNWYSNPIYNNIVTNNYLASVREGWYTGTGDYGESSPVQIPDDLGDYFYPCFLIVQSVDDDAQSTILGIPDNNTGMAITSTGAIKRMEMTSTYTPDSYPNRHLLLWSEESSEHYNKAGVGYAYHLFYKTTV